jgi:hypothetical protein
VPLGFFWKQWVLPVDKKDVMRYYILGVFMLKNVFLIISICILFFGCKNSKNYNAIGEYENNKIPNDNYELEDYNYEYEEDKITILDRLLGYSDYYKSYYYSIGKLFSVKYEEDILFLKKFTQDDLSDYIESFDFVLDSEITALPYITSLSNITSLGFDSTSKNISAIANYKNLESLTIFFRHDFEDIEGMNAIFDLPNLKKLMIYGPYHGSKTDLIDLTNIGKLEKLEYLFITGCYVDQDGLNNLDNLMQLEELHIRLINIVDFSPLLSLPNLERLTISSVHNYYDIVLPLATSKSLETINFIFNCSDEEYYKFMENNRRIFSENGIYIHWNDRR